MQHGAGYAERDAEDRQKPNQARRREEMKRAKTNSLDEMLKAQLDGESSLAHAAIAKHN